MDPTGIQAVIFDMDGVIVNSEPHHERAFLEVAEDIGYGDGRHGLTFSHYVGRSDRELWVDFLQRNRPEQTLEQLLVMKRERVAAIIRQERPLFPGLLELVRRLAERYPLALASGSERLVVDEVLKLEGLSQYFLHSVSCDDAPRGKPAPDIFLRAALLLGIAPSACCVIEDSKPGVRAGLAAGMRVIAVTNTHPKEELSHAHHVAESYGEIARLLLPAD